MTHKYKSRWRTCCLCPNRYDRHKHRGFKCASCEKRIYRKKHPEKYAYDNLRSNSKQRGIPFTISFEYFKQFCHENDYIQKKGITKHSLSLGYIPGNLQVLTVSENSKKGKKKLVYDDLARRLRVKTFKTVEGVESSW